MILKEINCKLRLVAERDIPILYQHLKEFLSESNSNVSGRPLPKFKDSEKFVLKYLCDNKNHEYDKWYVVLDEHQNIIGNVVIDKKNWISYHILKLYQAKGYGQQAIKLLMKKNPRERYFATINQNNISSLNIIKKFGFKPKAIIFEKVSDV